MDVVEKHSLIVPTDFQNTWVEGLSDELYHGDKTAVNSGSLKRLLKSPASFYAAHMLGEAKKDTKALRIGRALHLALLEPRQFERLYVRLPEFVGRTRDGRESTQSAEARQRKQEWLDSLPAGSIVLSDDQHAMLMGMIHSVLKHQDASRMLKYGFAERVGYFRDPDTGIKCRIKPDLFHPTACSIIDIKSTMDCSLREFSKQIWNLRYDFQLGMYCLGVEMITGKKPEYPLFLAIEKEPPYEVALYLAEPDMIEKGQADFRKAMATLMQCIEKKAWPSYQERVQPINLPKWAYIVE